MSGFCDFWADLGVDNGSVSCYAGKGCNSSAVSGQYPQGICTGYSREFIRIQKHKDMFNFCFSIGMYAIVKSLYT